jgi:hypothetical protein
VIEAALNMIAKANTFHLHDVKTVILHPAGNLYGKTEILDPVTTINIKAPVLPQPVKTVAHLYSKHSEEMTAITLRLHQQCHSMETRHRSMAVRYHLIRRLRHRPPIQFASNTVLPDMDTIMMITDGVVEEEATVVVTEEIIMAVRKISFGNVTSGKRVK